MIDTDFLEILCCPETHQKLHAADPAMLQQLNGRISQGLLKNRAGAAVLEPIESGLVRQDGKILYAVRQGIPVMLVDEGIPLT